MTEEKKTGNTSVNTELKARFHRRGVEFRRADAWQRIEDHVGTHKYLLDLREKTNVDWSDAALSWEERVMSPLLEAFERQHLREAFPDQPTGDLFIEISDHWYFLKQSKPAVSPDEAVSSFRRRFAKGVRRWFSRGILAALRDGWENGSRIDSNVRRARDTWSELRF